MKKIFFLLSFIMGCASCNPTVYVPTDSDKCSAACSKLKSLGCEEGEPIVTLPTIAGSCTQGIPVDSDASSFGYVCQSSCEDFCRSTQSNLVFLNPTCVVEKLQKCSDLETICKTNPHK